MSDKNTLRLMTSFVTFAALANMVRFFWDIPVTIGRVFLPGWTGGIAYLVLGILAAWSFKAISALSSPCPIDPSDHLE